MDNIVTDAFEQVVNLPGELIKTAGQQIKGPPKQAADAAKKRLPALVANDQKIAAQKIDEIRKELGVSKPVEPKKKKDIWTTIRNQQYNQTGERKVGGFG